MDHAADPVARSLDDFPGASGVMASFHAGSSGQSHRWKLRSASGAVLAQTQRVHRGGRFAQAVWKFLTLTGLDANNDIHVEVRGAQDRVLARITSVYDKPAVVRVTTPDGNPVVHSVRDKDTFTLHGPDETPLVEFTCDEGNPWQVRNAAGIEIGQLLAGEPGASLSPPMWQWIDPQFALSTATYARTMHLGLRRVKQYSYAPTQADQVPALALLPLLCGLTY